MWIEIVIGIAAICALIGIGGVGLLNIQKSPPAKGTIIGTTTTITTNRLIGKDKVREKLIALANSPLPTEKLLPGAMCYSPVPIPTSVDYICPVDGTKTVYTIDNTYYVYEYLPRVRNLAKQIRGIHLELDEREFCKQCSPNIEKPQLYIVIQYSQTDTVRIQTDGVNDLLLIQDLLQDKRIHTYANDGQDPLKNSIERIEELLGIKVL